jgi:tetratricopeptide (TPR) repeat protein
MSENTDYTQPNQPVGKEDTQPLKPVKKTPRWRSILISILGFLLLISLGAFGGFRMGIGDRLDARNSSVNQIVAQQYQFALVDIQFGRYEAAKQRLEFIIANDPSFPGVQEKLTEVLVMSTIPTITPTITPTATPDFSGAESAYQRAQQLILSQDWPGALTALDQIRKLDSTYKTAQVDGMYYFALRNYGSDLILKQGNLEGGIYQLALAERFGPLDNTVMGLREGARLYITGASFWELDWSQAVNYFSQVGTGWPSLWDGTMTGSQRYHYALMRYGDNFFEEGNYCSAYEQYQAAAAIGNLDNEAANHANQSYQLCYPATDVPPTITSTSEVPVATTAPAATEPPTEPPTVDPNFTPPAP